MPSALCLNAYATLAADLARPVSASDAVTATIANPNLIMFSERNSEALNATDNEAFGAVEQDDYDTWAGEAALVQWGPEAGRYAEEGWIRFNRHSSAANYIFHDGHAQTLNWSDARTRQYPDFVVRHPVDAPPC